MSKHTQYRGRSGGQAGFSMVEISLALLVVATGLLILMAFFPTGLQELESATEKTRTAMFADDQFNRFQANALLVDSAAEFQVLPPESNIIFERIVPGDVSATNGLRWRYYALLYTNVVSAPVWRVRLEIKNGLDGPFTPPDALPVIYYTELIYGTIPP